MIKAHFLKADKGNDKIIDLNEIDAFLESLNLKLKKEQISTLLDVRVISLCIANYFYHFDRFVIFILYFSKLIKTKMGS